MATPIDLFTDTGENEAVEAEAPGTPSPTEYGRLASEPATMLWTIRQIQRYSSRCWAKQWIRRFRFWLAIAIGFGIAVNVTGWAVLTIRIERTVREVLKAEREAHSTLVEPENPHPIVAKVVSP